MKPFVSPKEVGDISDGEWLDLLDRSLDGSDVDGARYPTFPDDETQKNFVGQSRRDALAEAVRFERYVLDAMAQVQAPATADCTVVDFGCGWGRITRSLLRDFQPSKVIGVDPLASMVAACRDWFAPSEVRFEVTNSWPPLPLPNDSVDLVVAYSVFSHLPEQLAKAWIADFARVLKPGGIVVATTQPRSFIELCEQMRTDPKYTESDFLWYKYLASSFVDTDDAYGRFDAGEFLHVANGGGEELPESLYGDSLFSGAYIEQSWAHLLDLVRYDDQPGEIQQAVFVLQKPGARGSSSSVRQARAEQRVIELEHELDAVKSSESWRIGQAALAPVRLARRVRHGRAAETPS